MPLKSSRASGSGALLFLFALGACADQPEPTQPQTGPRPHLAVGDVIVVTSAIDGNDGSLRKAVEQTTGGETIRFAPNLAGTTLTFDQTLILPNRVTIEGPADKGITLSGSGKHTVLVVRDGATLVNLTITEGKSDIDVFAGGILSTGAPLVLDHSAVVRNEGTTGAGVRGDTITLINSTVSDNTTPDALNVAAGVNYNFHGALTLINSTISNNIGGSGIAAFGATSFTPLVTLRNSIISNNGRSNCRTGTAGFVYEGRNMSDDESCGKASLAMRVGDPLLEPLANNGGPTPTHALGRNSLAIDGAVGCAETTDQRYIARDAICDIGAFEFVFTTISLTIDPGASVDSRTGAVTLTGRLQCSRDETFDLAINVQQDQKVKKLPTLVQTTKNVPVACLTTSQPWIALVEPPSGEAFVNGDALAAARTVNIANGVTATSASSPLKLSWAKK